MTYRDFPFQAVRADEDRPPVLQGQTAIVTAAGSGIGRAVAMLFAQEGANVVVADLDGQGAEETVAAIEAAQDAVGPLRVLVNCAGTGFPMKTGSKGKPHDLSVFRKVMEINLIGTFNAISAPNKNGSSSVKAPWGTQPTPPPSPENRVGPVSSSARSANVSPAS